MEDPSLLASPTFPLRVSGLCSLCLCCISVASAVSSRTSDLAQHRHQPAPSVGCGILTASLRTPERSSSAPIVATRNFLTPRYGLFSFWICLETCSLQFFQASLNFGICLFLAGDYSSLQQTCHVPPCLRLFCSLQTYCPLVLPVVAGGRRSCSSVS